MRYPVLAFTVLPLIGPSLAAQTLDRRIAAAPDGTVAMTFDARPGVCGDARTFIAEGWDTERGRIVYTSRGSTWINDDLQWRADCRPGPIRVVMHVRRGTIVDLRTYAGNREGGPPRAATELGHVSGQDAVAFLLHWAERARDENLREAMLAASIAEGVVIADRLSTMAQNKELQPAVRERALRLLVPAADREANHEALSVPRRIAADPNDVTAVRERAIRVLGDTDDGDEAIRSLYRRLGVHALRERAIRVIGEFGGDTNARWLEAIAANTDEPLDVRERAIRVLGDDLHEVAELRALYGRIEEPSLRERVVRISGEAGGRENEQWLQQIARDGAERRELRERAVRVLGEMGSADFVRDLYPDVDDPAIRERILRIVAEYGRADDVTWLRGVATDPSERSAIRDRAVRLLEATRMRSQDLAALYDDVDSRALRDRILRLLGERRDDAAIDKLITVARDDADASLRRRAMRILADSGHPRALEFLTRAVGGD